MSLRFSPLIEHPLSGYQVSLITLPEVVPSPRKKVKVSSPKPPPPVAKPKVKESVMRQPVEPVKAKPTPAPPRERLADSFAGAIGNVVVPQQRVVPAMKDDPGALPELPPIPARQKAQETGVTIQPPPRAPELLSRQPLLENQQAIPSSSQPEPLTQTLKQAVQSVSVPQTPPSNVSESPPATQLVPQTNVQKGKKASAQSARILLPPQAPPLAEATPHRRQPQERPMKQARLSDTLKKAVQSVVVPQVQKPTARTSKKIESPLLSKPQVPQAKPQTRKPKELDTIVLPPQVPQLATVDVANATTQAKEVGHPSPRVGSEEDVLDQRIARLTIPDVQVPEPHRILSQHTQRGTQNTMTTLQVAGSSPQGNPYWGRVWAKIDSEWVAPSVSAQSGKALQVLLAFRIEHSGEVKNLVIERSSGNEYYDLAAKRAVLMASPLPPFPSDMSDRYYDLQFQFTVDVDS